MPQFISCQLHKAGSINAAAYGSFSGVKQHELAVAKGSSLDLLRPDESGKLVSMCPLNCFSVIRSLMAFRLMGSSKDYLVVGSDSGKISIMEYNTRFGKGSWTTVHCETFGKTGCRRVVPGQYLCCDPKGRAMMVGAVEKQRFVYILNRDADNKLTISSPLEAHRGETILFSCVGLDVGLENPVFACLEMEYGEADADPTGEAASEVDKTLTLYELDLGLNHVIRKWCEPVSRLANFLLAVPGGDDGPGGVLICGENWVSYRNEDHAEVRSPLPRRMDLPLTRGCLITAGVLHKQKGMFFFLLQSEHGDLFKVSLETVKSDGGKGSAGSTAEATLEVRNVIVSVFDTIRVSTSLSITRSGLLFAASEHSDHALYQFSGLGDNAECVRAEVCTDRDLGDDIESAASVAPLFKPSRKLSNLVQLDTVSSLGPLTGLVVETGEESTGLITAADGTVSSLYAPTSGDADSSQQGLRIHALCGKGNHSSVRVLRHGSSVSELARSDLPGRPVSIWTLKEHQEDEYDKYIVVSFSNATIVLKIGEAVEEETGTAFNRSVKTLGVSLLADDTSLQVHEEGIRHMKADKRVVEWKTPGGRPVSRAVVNSRQAILVVDRAARGGGLGSEIICFELDAAGQLTEVSSLEVDTEVCCIDVGMVSQGRARFPFLAVGHIDNTVSVLSLDPADPLQQRAIMQAPARPSDVKFTQIDSGAGASAGTEGLLSLNIGLQSGVLIRVSVDTISGALSDSRQRFLGGKPLKLARVNIDGIPGLLALTISTWIMYHYAGSFHQAPVAYDQLDEAHSFSSEACPGGMVVTVGKTLRICSVDDLGTMFSQQVVPLSYTPRHALRVPYSTLLVTLEADHHEYNDYEKKVLSSDGEEMAVAGKGKGPNGSSNGRAGGGGDEEEEEEEEDTMGPPLRGPVPELDGKWASCLRVTDSSTGETVHQLDLQQNQTALCMCACTFYLHSQELFVVVGVATGVLLHPRTTQSNRLCVYRFVEGGQLSLLHSTEVEAPPLCMTAFQGRLLVGVGRVLRLYDLGKKMLLKKCESRPLPIGVARLAVSGDRVFAGDIAESVYFVKYNRQANTLCIFAEDEVPRYVSCLCALDYDTVAVGDKFGNFLVLRVPEDVDDSLDDSPARVSIWESARRAKVVLESHYYVGSAITSLIKTRLCVGGKEVILASTISGGLHAFVPAAYKAEFEFFEQLQMLVRREYRNPCGRDHRAFRSYYQPTKNVVDGELCEQFTLLPFDQQVSLAQEMDRTPVEISRKLEEIRAIL